ncbi:MAG: hypothetical protein WCO12_02080 [bacterium]
MSPERRGEIAYAYLKAKNRKAGIPGDANTVRREIGNTINEPELKEISVTPEEALEFVAELLKEVVEGFFTELNTRPKGK